MAGHVSMMNDVLIAQLNPTMLRSALRSVLAQVPSTSKILLQNVRSRFLEFPPPLVKPSTLFPSSADTTELRAYLATSRCMFSSHLVVESLPYLTHLVEAIELSSAKWAPGSEIGQLLSDFSGDIIQAVQALKESAPTRSKNLQELLLHLLHALFDCSEYCQTSKIDFPFHRAQMQVADVLSLLFPTVYLNGHATPVDSQLEYTPINPAVTPELINLGSLEVPRLFNGLWQMSSTAWGSASEKKVDLALTQVVQHGFVATDMADHYGDAELIYGSFRNRLPPAVGSKVIAATKWCIFKPIVGEVNNEFVFEAVKERSRRLGGRVELLQFHWQDYSNKDFLFILKTLLEITKSHPDLVQTIGLCNFDAKSSQEVCEYLLRETGEVGIVSNQVQYSLIDSRPIFDVAEVCMKYGIKLLTYGSFCGGFLSDRWLNAASPDLYSEATSLTPSQRKYFDMISTWGSWEDFQSLLQVLGSVASKYNVDISNIATRWVLQRPEVAAVIVGTRLGVSSNVETNSKVFTFALAEDDIAAIEEAALGAERSKSLALFKKIGDCGTEYR